MTKDTLSILITNIKCCEFDASIAVADSIDDYENKKYIIETYDINDDIEVFINDEVVQESSEIVLEAVGDTGFINNKDKDRYDKYLNQYKYDFKTNDPAIGELNRHMAEALVTGFNASEKAKGRMSIKIKDLRYFKSTDEDKRYAHKNVVTEYLIKEILKAEEDDWKLCIYTFGVVPFGGDEKDTTEDTGLVYWYITLPKQGKYIDREYLTAKVMIDKYNDLKKKYPTPESRKSEEWTRSLKVIKKHLQKLGKSNKEVEDAFNARVNEQKKRDNQTELLCAWHISKSYCPDTLADIIKNPGEHQITINKGFNIHDNLGSVAKQIAKFFDFKA